MPTAAPGSRSRRTVLNVDGLEDRTTPATFTVTNTGNFTDNVRFKASGASVQIASGSATVASAFIDVNGNGTYEAGTDIDIKGNAADVVSPNVAQNASLSVVVFVNVNGAAAAGSIIDVRLGDTAAGTHRVGAPPSRRPLRRCRRSWEGGGLMSEHPVHPALGPA